MTSRTYTRAVAASRQAWTALGGGLFGLVMAGLMYAQQIAAPPARQSLLIPGLVGAMVAASLVSLFFGYRLARSPTVATLDDDGLLLEGPLASPRRLRWSQVAELQRQKMQRSAREQPIDVLVLRDAAGRTLARMPGTFEGFPDLVADVEARSTAARGRATYDRNQEVARKLKGQKREQRLLGGMGVAFVAAGVVLTWLGGDEMIHRRALDAEGVPAEARIVRRYQRASTPRLEYAFTDATGAVVTRDAALSTAAWLSLESAPSVPIVYLRDSPDWSRLAQGEVDLVGSPAQSLLIALLGFAMGAAALTFVARGYCGIETRNGKTRLVRYGDVG